MLAGQTLFFQPVLVRWSSGSDCMKLSEHPKFPAVIPNKYNSVMDQVCQYSVLQIGSSFIQSKCTLSEFAKTTKETAVSLWHKQTLSHIIFNSLCIVCFLVIMVCSRNLMKHPSCMDDMKMVSEKLGWLPDILLSLARFKLHWACMGYVISPLDG